MTWIRLSLLTTTLCLLAACGQSRLAQMERVARDWCETIRAAQVLPVYPLTEDVQPGDVFVVQTPLSQQAAQYRERGFLPLDQLATRLPVSDDPKVGAVLPYHTFYRDSYWKGSYASVAHARPLAAGDPVLAPRAAFPTYSFTVQQGTGLQLALPIQGVPVGLGLMGASRASGSVMIRDAYTYGVDTATLIATLDAWWSSHPDIQRRLRSIVSSTSEPVYLRVVNRVYLTRGVTVTLNNLRASGAAADVGAAPEVTLLELSVSDPKKAADALAAYQNTVAALKDHMSVTSAGGALRIAQASQRAVTLDEAFDRPLVIGYLGFDVKVMEDGSLSPPIPSFSVVTGQSTAGFEAIPFVEDDLSDQYVDWLTADPSNRESMVQWLSDNDIDADPADIAHAAEFQDVLKRANARFKFASDP